MLIVDGIEYRYEGASFRFDLEVSRGEVLCVIGPSGAGKSTLLYLVAGFLAPVSGRIVIDGADVTALPPESRPVTTVFQEHNLFPHLTVFDNVALGVSPALKLDATARRRVGEALERVHLAGRDHRRPGELSGGQRQRVTLARALVRQRPVLLLDEPFTALGPALRRELLELIGNLVRDERLAAILVSHHPADARLAAARTAFVSEGRIRLIGDTGRVLDPATDPEIARYLGAAD